VRPSRHDESVLDSWQSGALNTHKGLSNISGSNYFITNIYIYLYRMQCNIIMKYSLSTIEKRLFLPTHGEIPIIFIIAHNQHYEQ